MAFSTQEDEALIRLLALPVMIWPSGSSIAVADTPAAFCFSSAGATTGLSCVERPISCMMRFILSTASALPLPCLWSHRALK